MVRITRSSSTTENLEDEESELVTDVAEEIGSKKITSDLNFAITVFIQKGEQLESEELHLVRHPKNNSGCLFRIKPSLCEEVLSINDNTRSWFYKESVSEDGSVKIFAPFHPIMLALPYFHLNNTQFKELDDILTDDQYPAIKMIKENTQFQSCIEKIADIKEVCDTTVYRLNEDLMVTWMGNRFSRLKSFLLETGAVSKHIIEDMDAVDRYVFGILCDFVSGDLVGILKTALKITDAPVETAKMGNEAPAKRKALEESPLIAKKPRESVAKKQLAQASKGTKNIGSFFTRKT